MKAITVYALCKKADKALEQMIHDMEGMSIQVVEEPPTPSTAQYNIMYLVDTNGDGKYEAYLKADIDGTPTIIELGPIIDLSDFYTKTQIDTLLNGKQALLTWDDVPTENSSNAISSGAIYNALTADNILYRDTYNYLPDDIGASQILMLNNGPLVISFDATYDTTVRSASGSTRVYADYFGDPNLTTIMGWMNQTDSQIFSQLDQTKKQSYDTRGYLSFRIDYNGKTAYLPLYYGNWSYNDVISWKDSALTTTNTIIDVYTGVSNTTRCDILYDNSQSEKLRIGYAGSVATVEGYGGWNHIPTGITAQKALDKIIQQIQDISMTADGVTYDNTSSGLTATNVQDAIDEILDTVEGQSHVELTQAEYNALTPEQKSAEVVYFITDAEAEGDFANLEQRLNALENALHTNNIAYSILETPEGAAPATITLPQNISNYDGLIFTVSAVDDTYSKQLIGYPQTYKFSGSDLAVGETVTLSVYHSLDEQTYSMSYEITNNTTLTLSSMSSGIEILEVIGIKEK